MREETMDVPDDGAPIPRAQAPAYPFFDDECGRFRGVCRIIARRPNERLPLDETAEI